jgi:hypothetical protein
VQRPRRQLLVQGRQRRQTQQMREMTRAVDRSLGGSRTREVPEADEDEGGGVVEEAGAEGGAWRDGRSWLLANMGTSSSIPLINKVSV